MIKAIGLVFVIVGAVLCFSCVGLIFGVPMILLGGVMVFD